MIRVYLLFYLFFFFTPAIFAQAAGSVEQYHSFGKNQPYSFVPIAGIRNNRQWYAEARYNYEDDKTFSLYLGKTFSREGKLSGSLTPMLGGSVGRFKGVTAALNVDLEYKDLFFSSQSQYSFSTGYENDDFQYSWSELGYQALPWLYGGISFQQTYSAGDFFPEVGLLTGFTFNRFTLPLYIFNPLHKDCYFMAGLIVEWKAVKKTARVQSPLLVNAGPTY